MTVEIKFRVWDRLLDEIIPWEIIKNNSFAHYEKANIGYGSMVFEQYTGFADMNGADVYEGDIVEFKTNERFERYPDEGTGRVVRSNSGMWIVVVSSKIITPLLFNDVTVVGNIHKSPELLEKN